MAIAHRKFYGNKPVTNSQYYDRVVSMVWSYDINEKILTYGASIFRREYREERWVRRNHHETAMKRYRSNPVRVLLHNPPKRMSNTAIEYFISSQLVYFFGCSDNTGKIYDRTLTPDFNKTYAFNNAGESYHCSYSEPALSQGCIDMLHVGVGSCLAILGMSGYYYFF